MDKLLDSVVNDVLLAQEARTMGLVGDPTLAAKVAGYRQRLMIDNLEADASKDLVDPTPEEIRAVFDRRYRSVTLRVVTAYEEADAQELRRMLDAGADMEALARSRSVDPYALRGGLVDDVEQIDLQRDIAATAFSLEPGLLAGPFRTDLGFSVIRVEAFHEPTQERFQQVKDACARLVTLAKQQQVKAKLTALARQHAPVTVDDKIVAQIVPMELPDGRLMADAPDPDLVVARIGPDLTLTVQEYTKALVLRWKGVRNKAAATATAPLVLTGLLDQKVFLAEAERLGYGEKPEIQRAVHAFETQLLVPRYLQETVGANVKVTREDLETYYQEHREQLRRPPKVRLGQITVTSMKQAEELARQLRQGADLAWLARQQSSDRYAETGGDRGWYTPLPDVEDFNRDLFTAETGTILDPLELEGNVVILKVLAREEQGIYEFDEITGNIRSAVEQQIMLRDMKIFMDKLRARAEITIYQDRLARLSIRGRPEEPAPGHESASPAAEDHGGH
jgi:parvulin-like peptidyl-prolyl isomerase